MTSFGSSNANFWSSSLNSNNAVNAWNVNLANGNQNDNNRGNSNSFLCVR